MATTTATNTKPMPTAVTDNRRKSVTSPTAEPKRNSLDEAASPPKPARPSPPPPARASADRAPTPPPPADDAPEPESSSDEIINMETFEQILELEEDDTYEFSLGMTSAYLAQAEDTFKDMDNALAAKDLKRLSDLGHFLKGSSAALGVQKVQKSCERMQNYGKCKDAAAENDITSAEALSRITTLLARVKVEFNEANKYLRSWFKNKGVDL